MTFKHKLSRRLALLICVVFVVGCERIGPTSPSGGGTVASVAVSPASASVAVGRTAQLTATPKDANGNPLTGRTITWASNNTAMATVSGSGLVTGMAAGSATVTATTGGQSGTAAVTVTNVPVASVTVSPATVIEAVGQVVQLTATPRDSNGTPLSGRVVTWASSAPAVASVDTSGLVMGVSVGFATIAATSEGKSGGAADTVIAVSAWYPNEPPGFTMLNDNPWDTPGGAGWTGAGTTFSIIQDPTAPRSPPNVGAGHFAAGTYCGVARWSLNFTLPQAVRKLYLAIWYRHVGTPAWLPHSVGSKFMWFQTPEYPTGFYSGFGGSNMRLGVWSQAGPEGAHANYPNITANLHWQDENGAGAGTTGYGWLGQWARVEYLLVQNTLGTANADGILQMWITTPTSGGPKLLLQRTDMAWSAAGDSHTWTAIKWNSTWGGGCAPANDQYEYQDHIYVSGSN